MSSIVDSLSNAVDGLASAVEGVSYSVADSVTEQVTNMIHGLRTDEEENQMKGANNKDDSQIPQDNPNFCNESNTDAIATDTNGHGSTLHTVTTQQRPSEGHKREKNRRYDNVHDSNYGRYHEDAVKVHDNNDLPTSERGERRHRSKETIEDGIHVKGSQNGDLDGGHGYGHTIEGAERRGKSKKTTHKSNDHRESDHDAREHVKTNNITVQGSKILRSRSPRNDHSSSPRGNRDNLEEKGNHSKHRRLPNIKPVHGDQPEKQRNQCEDSGEYYVRGDESPSSRVNERRERRTKEKQPRKGKESDVNIPEDKKVHHKGKLLFSTS